jgi:hypothetical protein
MKFTINYKNWRFECINGAAWYSFEGKNHSYSGTIVLYDNDTIAADHELPSYILNIAYKFTILCKKAIYIYGIGKWYWVYNDGDYPEYYEIKEKRWVNFIEKYVKIEGGEE